MSRRIQITVLSAALFLGGVSGASAQYGGAQYARTQPVAADQICAAVQTLLVQVDHLVEDMEVDLVRDPVSEQLMTLAYDVQDEVEHLAASVERGVDLAHAVRDFQQFDVQWHRLTRQVVRVAANDRHLQRNTARLSQTDAELHRLLRVPVPVDVQEVRVLTSSMRRASAHLREDIEADLRGIWQQREILERVATLEESAEHLEVSIARGVDVRHIREDFEAVDEAWLNLARPARTQPDAVRSRAACDDRRRHDGRSTASRTRLRAEPGTVHLLPAGADRRLGSHGVPINVSVKDEFGVRRDVFVCCEDCEEKLEDHPEKYLHKLPE